MHTHTHQYKNACIRTTDSNSNLNPMKTENIMVLLNAVLCVGHNRGPTRQYLCSKCKVFILKPTTIKSKHRPKPESDIKMEGDWK